MSATSALAHAREKLAEQHAHHTKFLAALGERFAAIARQLDAGDRAGAIAELSKVCDFEHDETGDCEHTATFAERLGVESELNDYDEERGMGRPRRNG